MKKTILITGSTDGIGFETAKMLLEKGHNVLIHGRNPQKLADVKEQLGGKVEIYKADMSNLTQVEDFANEVKMRHEKIDVLINNAGVYRTSQPLTEDGLDARYVVNTIAPYYLTQKLLPILANDGRVVNLSSAAQTTVNPRGFFGEEHVMDGQAYAESKLALTMWTNSVAKKLEGNGQVFVSVNPKSFLASKMVKEAYGMTGTDLSVGADILTRAATSDEFANASGKYFDNDVAQFADPHPDALDMSKNNMIVEMIEKALEKHA